MPNFKGTDVFNLRMVNASELDYSRQEPLTEMQNFDSHKASFFGENEPLQVRHQFSSQESYGSKLSMAGFNTNLNGRVT